MGFVAELQQLDTTPTPPRIVVDTSAPHGPADRPNAEVVSADPTLTYPATTDPGSGSAGSGSAGSARDGLASDGLASDGPAPVDPAVAAFEGGPVATATATDDATADFLLGWVREPGPASRSPFLRGR